MFLLIFIFFFTACFSTPQSSASGRPAFTIINNTGYIILYVHIQPVSVYSWGQDWLNSNQTMSNGQSLSWYLSERMTAGERYDIRIIDSNNFTYTKSNVLISSNSRFTFTINDADARYTTNTDFTLYFLWSTGANQQNSGIRSISITDSRAEILRLYKLYNRFIFNWDSTNHYESRRNYQNFINNQYDEYQRLNNQYSFAHINEVPDFSRGRIDWYRSVLVTIVKGNEVIRISFTNIDPVGHSYPTSENNRRFIENILNNYLD